jgi:hypothetical protein
VALRKTEAVILKRREVRETSLVLSAFSRELGKFHGLVKGVRGVSAAVPWYLEPMTLQAMVLYERKRSPWALVSHCDLVDPFEAVHRDFVGTAYGALCLDLVDEMMEIGQPHPEIFEQLCAALRALGAGGRPAGLVRWLEACLLQASGLLPEVASLPLSPRAKEAMQRMLAIPPDPAEAARLSGPVEGELRPLLQGLVRRAPQEGAPDREQTPENVDVYAFACFVHEVFTTRKHAVASISEMKGYFLRQVGN